MNKDEGEQGYNYSRLWLNDYLKSIDAWDIDKYNERFDLIYNRFLKIWGYPDIEVPVYDDGEEQNIFNAESPTHKKLEYFIFENDKIEERDVADMYYLVIKILFEKNAQIILDK